MLSAPSNQLVLGRYRLGGRIGAGAAGSVFRATDTTREHDVVVKFFDGEEDGYSPWASEMRLVLRFKHPNIVSCLDVGFDQDFGLWVLVLQQAHGGSLRRWLASGRQLSQRQIAHVLLDVSSALAYAHAQGVVHRDVKPENVLAEHAGGDTPWLLTDFGAGRFLAPGQVARSLSGSLEYLAPEVLTAGATAVCDQFSLGVMGLELLCGRLPAKAERQELLRPMRQAKGLAAIVARLAAEDPGQRYLDMVTVVTHLQQAVKAMKQEQNIVEFLRPHLIGQLGLSPVAVEELVAACQPEGSFLELLVERRLLDRARARTINAIHKGYVDIPVATVLSGASGALPGLPISRLQGAGSAPENLLPGPPSAPVPSSSPAALPSSAPAALPSPAPAGAPSPAPAGAPSPAPAGAPSPAPAAVPSPAPAAAPNSAPAAAPSSAPAAVPEASPAVGEQPDSTPLPAPAPPAPSTLSLPRPLPGSAASEVAGRPSIPLLAAAAPRAPIEVGMRLGRYVLQEQLGEGTTANVFRSFHEMLNIPVAIKVFKNLDASGDPGTAQRFLSEAQTLVRLDHPNIVRVLDVDLYEQYPYIVMEYVGEMTLAAHIQNLGQLPAPRIAQVGIAVAEALEAATRLGLLHRDIKPSNILERKDGHIKLVDFGIATSRGKDGLLGDPLAARGLVSGTPSYIAPEQAQNPSAIDFRADMYGLGASLYHAAVGRPPFVRATVEDIMKAHIYDTPVSISQLAPGFSLALAAVIHRLLAKRPEDRFASWAQVKEALASTLSDELELSIAESSGGALAPVDGLPAADPLATTQNSRPAIPKPDVPPPTLPEAVLALPPQDPTPGPGVAMLPAPLPQSQPSLPMRTLPVPLAAPWSGLPARLRLLLAAGLSVLFLILATLFALRISGS